MRKSGVFYFFVACVLTACSSNPAEQKEGVQRTSDTAIIHKMDILEKMFNNDNWMKVSGTDTSYYYFSRILAEMHVHQYRIVKGDSVITNISSMKLTSDSIVWKFNDSTDLYLSAITENSSTWANSKSKPSDPFYMSIELMDDKHIHLVFSDKRIITLTRTLPLSSFLTRSRYDYLHGTKYAFNDTVFSTGKAKINFAK